MNEFIQILNIENIMKKIIIYFDEISNYSG